MCLSTNGAKQDYLDALPLNAFGIFLKSVQKTWFQGVEPETKVSGDTIALTRKRALRCGLSMR